MTDPIPPASLADISGLSPDGALMGLQLSLLRTEEATCYLQRLQGFGAHVSAEGPETPERSALPWPSRDS